jgi:replicative superfamily II helicase
VSLYHLAKAVELLGTYCGKGAPKDIVSELKFHYLRSIRAASSGGLIELDVLLRWLRAASIQMARNSIWWLLPSLNVRISEHVRHLAAEDAARPLLELLPPQRRALLEDGLLDPAHRAVVVQMPTSSGKMLLAEFRILQAINSFPGCWIAYLVPTRALVNQVALRLRRDFEPLQIRVESAAPVQEVDIFEEEWLTSAEDADVVVTTPEKLDLVIRGAKRSATERTLGLVILDEVHNLGEGERGVRAELLLAMLNQEYPDAHFLLLTPFVPNSEELALWLDDQRSRAITVLATEWQPNDRAIGIAYPEGRARNWNLRFRTLHTMPANVEAAGSLPLDGQGPLLDLTASAVRGSKSKIAAATARVLSRCEGSSCIILADSPGTTWNIAELLEREFPRRQSPSWRVDLVKRFCETEFSPDFKLCHLLEMGIALHHGGLSPELRFLVEWLTEEGDIKILIATTTLAQGVNFPVSSVVLATHYLYYPNRGRTAS